MKFTSEIGVLKGKFSYMSPEQIRGMPLDARTDIFSSGIILHEMLTTEKLFRGDTEFQLMEKVRKADIPPPSKFNRRVTPELDAVVAKALARNVNERYQSAAEFGDALKSLLEQYRFQPKELREFMRARFRAEAAKEYEDTEAARTAQPLADRPDADTGESARIKRETDSPEIMISHEPEPEPPPDVPTPPQMEDVDLKSGFWSRFKRKPKK
jgi:serine/threonine protein kinase